MIAAARIMAAARISIPVFDAMFYTKQRKLDKEYISPLHILKGFFSFRSNCTTRLGNR
jgi:hypothetical protein